MRQSYIGLPALISAVLLTAPFVGDAGATTLVFLDVPAKARGADLIVQATVVSQGSRWTGDGRRIVTDTVVKVGDVWKSHASGAPPKTVTVRQPGGVVGDLAQRVDGVARFEEGEEVVLFLEARPGGAWLLHGMAQGKYRIERTSDGKGAFAVPAVTGEARLIDPKTGAESVQRNETVELSALRRQVAQAVGSAPEQGAPSGPVTPVKPEGK